VSLGTHVQQKILQKIKKYKNTLEKIKKSHINAVSNYFFKKI